MESLADLSWPEAETRGASGGLLVVPVGSTEQHGPHLPLSTDTDIALALAARLARALPGAVVAPAIAYGSSGEHGDFAGTLSIGRRAVELVLTELVRSASATFERTVLISTHGGNAEPVARATGRLAGEGRSVLSWSPRWEGDAHAGHVETSIMLALAPQLVALDRAAAGNSAPLDALWTELRSRGVRAVAPNGVLGDPLGATVEEGLRLLDAAERDLIATVSVWSGGSPVR